MLPRRSMNMTANYTEACFQAHKKISLHKMHLMQTKKKAIIKSFWFEVAVCAGVCLSVSTQQQKANIVMILHWMSDCLDFKCVETGSNLM